MAEILKTGDVIDIKKGMRVYVDIPGKFIYSNRTEASPTANELTSHDVSLGQVFKTTKNVFDTSIYLGEYVVTNREYGGGGIGMGSHDVFPSGWQIFCKKLKNGIWDENGLELNFYQTGSFTAMIKPREIEPIRKMKQKFVNA